MVRHLGREEGLCGVGPAGKEMMRRVVREEGLRGVGLRSQGTLQCDAVALRAMRDRMFTFLCSLRPSPLPPSVDAPGDRGRRGGGSLALVRLGNDRLSRMNPGVLALSGQAFRPWA